MNDKKTILITGGAGFIGSHLVSKYLEEGHFVMCLDNLQTTRTPKNIRQFMKHPNFRFMKQDVIVPIHSDRKIDWIMNFACSGSYTSYQYDPVHTMQTNTVGMINMLELAKKHGARIMQASTSEIYGDPLEVPQKETYKGNVNSLGPRACYDEGKRAAETLCMDYHREYGTDVRIIRIFNTYGPNMDPNDGRAVTNFLMNALDNKDLVIYGDGSATRSFQYIDDLIRGIDLMMQKDGFIGPVNLGNPGEITMKDLAERAISLTHSNSKIVYERGATDDPKRRCPDITLAKQELGWEPVVNLEEGLIKTITYFKEAPRADRKVLVLATTYHPMSGPAEQAIEALSKEMEGVSFHVVTSRMDAKLPRVEEHGKDTIYRVGFGTPFDKFLLPILGAYRAHKLHRVHGYTFAWSIMGSYSGLAAFLLKKLGANVVVLMTIDEGELEGLGPLKRALYRVALKSADTVFATDKAANASLLDVAHQVELRDGNAKSFMQRVRHTYAGLLNSREQKLARPK